MKRLYFWLKLLFFVSLCIIWINGIIEYSSEIFPFWVGLKGVLFSFGFLFYLIFLYFAFKKDWKRFFIYGSVSLIFYFLSSFFRTIKTIPHILKTPLFYFHTTFSFLGYIFFISSFIEYVIEEKNKYFEFFLNFGLISWVIGIIVGSVWADRAWGIWWNWDPKETTSLITALFYGSFLSLRNKINLRWIKTLFLSLILFSFFLTFYGYKLLNLKTLH